VRRAASPKKVLWVRKAIRTECAPRPRVRRKVWDDDPGCWYHILSHESYWFYEGHLRKDERGHFLSGDADRAVKERLLVQCTKCAHAIPPCEPGVWDKYPGKCPECGSRTRVCLRAEAKEVQSEQ